MNYRHHYHAGNFADVMKHALLIQLLRGMQSKAKGLLYLDTHAGRGVYDLTAASKGDSRVREPEWPNGIGRLWARQDLPEPLADYVTAVKQFDHDRGNRDALPRYYPGSPSIARLLARPQDRLALYEKQPEEFAALSEEFQFAPKTTLQPMDGYVGVRAMLPSLERRALVLIDPTFEEQGEFRQVIAALRDGLKRLPGGVFTVWYPLTERANAGAFFAELIDLKGPPTLVVELAIAGEQSGLKMRGCGLAIINPPWRFDLLAEPVLAALADIFPQAAGAGYRVNWLVPEE